MIAIDTNVLVRFLMLDDANQSPVAQRVFTEEQVLIGPTVLLETDWVLRGSFARSPKAIGEAFRALFGLPNVHFLARDATIRAVAAMEAGVDFADALHALTTEGEVESFGTFDVRFARQAAKHDLPPVRLLAAKGA